MITDYNYNRSGGNIPAFDPSAVKIAPLKSVSGDIINDRGRQIYRDMGGELPAAVFTGERRQRYGI